MRLIPRTVSCFGLLFVGYLLGALQFGAPSPLRADPSTDAIQGTVRDKLRSAEQALAEAMQLLQDEKRYVPAILGLNAFATTVGGVDAIADLESGQGVDPETFAGLYAGQAIPEVAEHLAHDAQGRVTYKSRVVRLYNPTRLKQLFAVRSELAPTGAGPAPKRAASTARKAAGKEKSEDAAEEKSSPAEK
ncbi:MAG TPA: hypothetical protein VEI07_20955 [Planctomycetaceae bacterium]|nr:hypothetical protein [Planctomycetaceae bacterium]